MQYIYIYISVAKTHVGGKPELYSLGFGDMVLNLLIHCPTAQLGPGSVLEFGSLRGVHIPQGNLPSILGIQQHPVSQPGCLSSVPHTTVWSVGIFQSCSCRPGAQQQSLSLAGGGGTEETFPDHIK